MARRNANLAGLAALGALGYKLASSGKTTGTRTGSTAAAEPDALMELADDQYNPDVRYGSSADLGDELGTRRNLETGEYYNTVMGPKRVPTQRAQGSKKPYSMTSDTVDPNVKRMVDTGDETGRLAKRYPKPEAKVAPRKLSYDERLAQIPGSSPEGWTGGTGERVTGSELSRNISNTLNATGGLSVPGFIPKMTQRQFNARAATRRAEEGLSDAEVADMLRRRALSEADTTGGAIGYKKGGKVKAKAKKMASGGMTKSSVSKRADGIATKGKTKCKMY